MSASALDHPVLGALLGDAEAGALFTVEAELDAMLCFEVALAGAEAELGLIPAGAVGAIVAGCEAFRPDMEQLAAATARDGLAVPELVRQLRAAVGGEHAVHLHLGATSQDVIDTALVLRLSALLDLLDHRMAQVLQRLDMLAMQAGTLPLMGRTRMQQALPVTWGDRISAWADPLRRQRARLAGVREAAIVLQFGGPVGTLDAFGAAGPKVAQALGRALGLPVPERSWHTGRDGLSVLSAWLSTTCAATGKLGQDIALMAQNELAEVRVAGAGGSSAMPHKRNPVAAEVLVSLARFAATLDGGFRQALVHEQERSGIAWTLEWLLLPQLCIATARSLALAADLLDALEFPTG